MQGADSLFSESRNVACQWVWRPGGRESDLSGNTAPAAESERGSSLTPSPTRVDW